MKLKSILISLALFWWGLQTSASVKFFCIPVGPAMAAPIPKDCGNTAVPVDKKQTKMDTMCTQWAACLPETDSVKANFSLALKKTYGDNVDYDHSTPGQRAAILNSPIYNITTLPAFLHCKGNAESIDGGPINYDTASSGKVRFTCKPAEECMADHNYSIFPASPVTSAPSLTITPDDSFKGAGGGTL